MDKPWWKRRTNWIAAFQTIGLLIPTFMATNTGLISDQTALRLSGITTGLSAVGLLIIRNLWKDPESGG